MSKKTVFFLKLAFLVLCGGVLLAVYLLGVPCPILTYLGFPCPGCGMTRAYLSLLRLDLRGAFSYNSAFWTVPFFFLLLLKDGRLVRSVRANTALVTLLLSCVAVSYAAALLKFFIPG